MRVYLAGPPFADEYRRRAAALVRDAGWEPVDPMRRDFRGRTEGHERELVEGDLADIDSCNAVLADFTAPDEGTAREAWYAHRAGMRRRLYGRDAATPMDGLRVGRRLQRSGGGGHSPSAVSAASSRSTSSASL